MYYIVYNPTAASGRAQARMHALETHMKALRLEYKVAVSQYAGHAVELVAQAVQGGCDCVVTMGGDGTILEAVRGYMRAGAPAGVRFGFLPGGTGNDLTRSLGIEREVSLAFDQMHGGVTKPVDIWQVNGEPFINVAGMGLDVDVLRWTERTKRFLRGSAAYMGAILLSILGSKSRRMRIVLDGEELERRVLVVTFSNGAYYGGGIHVCPPADPCDGMVDVVIINHVAKWRMPGLLTTYRSGRHLERIPQCEYRRARRVRVEPEQPLDFQFDGEIHQYTPIDIEHSGKRIEVMVGGPKP